MVIGRPVAAPMQPHAKVRAKSAARRLDRGMPARVARQDAAMERRPARASRQRLAAERQHPRRGADRRSVPFGSAGGRRENTGSPRAANNRGGFACLVRHCLDCFDPLAMTAAVLRHCEERSDEAIQYQSGWIASLRSQ